MLDVGYFSKALATLALVVAAVSVSAEEAQPKFLGSQTCSSSSCHGGAGEKSKQFTIWSTHDFHHARPYATLETARSERIAEVLKIGNPTQSARCTICHAPFATVPAERLGHDAAATEGVSCENCHGSAENWIRSHTRPDYTHADRVASGMRDLHNLYVRANTCVACHQNIDPEIRAAGHPELIFELDGQSVTMPKHWSKEVDSPAIYIWQMGQLVALREMSWELSREKAPSEDLKDRWNGLAWIVQTSSLSENVKTMSEVTPENLRKAQDEADEMARDLGKYGDQQKANVPDWTRKALLKLAATSPAFQEKSVPTKVQARRAELLVLALDRLGGGINIYTNSAANQSLNKLFADAQSLPDFNPDQFANDLNTFHSSVAGFLETK
jgi:Zn-finger protein